MIEDGEGQVTVNHHNQHKAEGDHRRQTADQQGSTLRLPLSACQSVKKQRLNETGHKTLTASSATFAAPSQTTIKNTMEYARCELSRIVGYQNPYSWSIDSRKEKQISQHQYYFLDRHGVNDEGDTALHRLLALHASPAVVRHFLKHMKEHQRLLNKHVEKQKNIQIAEGTVKRGNGMCCTVSSCCCLGPYAGLPCPPRIDQTNHKGVTALHVAVYRNSWHVDEVVKLLIEECPALATMTMKPCGNSPLHIVCGLSITIRRQVLDVLLKASGKVVWTEDCEGNNPLSLLWKNVLRFRWARQWEEDGLVPMAMKGDLSWMTVIAPSQFLDYSLSLLESAYGKRNLDWNNVCGFPRCPPLLIKMLLQQPSSLKGSLLTPDSQGRYPIHSAAECKAVNHTNVAQSIACRTTPLVQLILNLTKGAFAGVADKSGRMPLHYACANQSAATLTSLVLAEPEALRVPDPLTGLHPAQQVAARHDFREQIEVTFEMLYACPDVVAYQGTLRELCV